MYSLITSVTFLVVFTDGKWVVESSDRRFTYFLTLNSEIFYLLKNTSNYSFTFNAIY